MRFAMFQNRFDELSDDEKRVIELVVETFGMYSGKTLERITHGETPWKAARVNCLEGEHSEEIISKKAIKDYFLEVSENYSLNDVNDIKRYIDSRLG